MHTYIKQDDSWSVGYWRGDRFERIADFSRESDAAAFCSYLNGGELTVSLLRAWSP